MKTAAGIKGILVMGLVLLFGQSEMMAQKVKSPKMTAEGKDVKVNYGQPSKRDRVVFGELVPYGEVWRAGANEATEISFAKNVVIDKKEIKAGTYSLFVIPQKDKWTIILNSTLGQWGSYEYDKIKDKDVVKAEIAVKKTKLQEKLTYSFKDTTGGTVLTIAWDEVEVELPISFK